jgi:hypothetical protein
MRRQVRYPVLHNSHAPLRRHRGPSCFRFIVRVVQGLGLPDMLHGGRSLGQRRGLMDVLSGISQAPSEHRAECPLLDKLSGWGGFKTQTFLYTWQVRRTIDVRVRRTSFKEKV